MRGEDEGLQELGERFFAETDLWPDGLTWVDITKTCRAVHLFGCSARSEMYYALLLSVFGFRRCRAIPKRIAIRQIKKDPLGKSGILSNKSI